MSDFKVHLYTDGAALGNPGPGGYGIVMEWVGKLYRKEFFEGFRLTTNNRMELLAVVVGLEMLIKDGVEVTVYSDSKYVVDSVNMNWLNGWIRKGFKDVKNPDLWKRLMPLLKKHKVNFVWIKGHNNHLQNERCDALAVMGANSPEKSVDYYYEDLVSGGNTLL